MPLLPHRRHCRVVRGRREAEGGKAEEEMRDFVCDVPHLRGPPTPSLRPSHSPHNPLARKGVGVPGGRGGGGGERREGRRTAATLRFTQTWTRAYTRAQAGAQAGAPPAVRHATSDDERHKHTARGRGGRKGIPSTTRDCKAIYSEAAAPLPLGYTHTQMDTEIEGRTCLFGLTFR